MQICLLVARGLNGDMNCGSVSKSYNDVVRLAYKKVDVQVTPHIASLK